MAVTRWLCLAALGLGCSARPSPAPPEPIRPAPSIRPLAPAAEPQAAAPAPRSACAAAGGLAAPAPPALEQGTDPTLANLRGWVHVLAGPELRGRAATTPDALRAARLIADAFAASAAEPAPGRDFCLPFSTGRARDVNVVAHLPSAGASCHVVIGAHYDALGVDARGRIRPGADDNATGVAVLLELARIWSAPEARPRVNVVLAAFGAEEIGLLGSAAWVAQPSVPLSDVRLYVNVDMAGRRLRDNPGLGYEASGPERATTVKRVHRAAFRSGVPVVAIPLGDRGDNASFSPHVPTLFLCTTVHADYHQPTDTPERVDYEQTLRAARIVRDLVEHAGCD